MATKEKKRYLLTNYDGSIYSDNETSLLGVHKNMNINMIWSSEINELEGLFETFKGQIPDLDKELERLIDTCDPIVVLLYARRSLEVIVTELCEKELKRPRKTQPLKGIIEILNCEEKVPSHIITSMLNLNSLSAYGAHPKDFDVELVKPVLNNLTTIIKWNLKYKQVQCNDKVNPPAIVYQERINKSAFVGRSIVGYLSLILMIILVAFYTYTKLYSSSAKMEIMDKSVAILPFKVITENHDQSFFCEGMTTAIVDHILKIEDLHIVADNSTAIYKDSKKADKIIAHELKAASLFRCKIFIAGNKVRISVYLIDGKTEKYLWNQKYESEIGDVFEIQSELASRIANDLKAQISQLK